MNLSLQQIFNRKSSLVPTFLVLGRNYLSELGMPEGRRDRFLLSMLDRQSEPDRWLYLMEQDDEHIGLIHMKIDRQDRPGWGFIMEFYIKQDKRRRGWGRSMYGLCESTLEKNGVVDVYLSTNLDAERFWSALGFRDSREIDAYNNQKIMTKSLL